MQGGERVVGNARSSIGDGGNQGGLSRIGHAQQAHIGKYLQLKLEISFFPRPARRLLPWRTVDRALEAHVAKTAVPAFGDGDDFARRQQLEQDLARFCIRNDGAHRHLQGDIVARRAKHVRAHAMFTTLGVMAPGKTIVHQRIQVGIRHGKNMTPAATVPAIGTAKFLVFFVPKRDAASSAISRRDVNIGFVDEFHESGFINEKPRAGRRVSVGAHSNLCRSNAHCLLVHRTFGGK